MLPLRAQLNWALHSGSVLTLYYANILVCVQKTEQCFSISQALVDLYLCFCSGLLFPCPLFSFMPVYTYDLYSKHRSNQYHFLKALFPTSVYAEFRNRKLPHLTLDRNGHVPHPFIRTQTHASCITICERKMS